MTNALLLAMLAVYNGCAAEAMPEPQQGLCRFESERFGASSSPHLQALRDTLEAGLVRELAAHQNANALASSQVRAHSAVIP